MNYIFNKNRSYLKESLMVPFMSVQDLYSTSNPFWSYPISHQNLKIDKSLYQKLRINSFQMIEILKNI